MKKLVAVLLVFVILCISCLSVSEQIDFSVRCGINFSSTKEEIIAYEESQKKDGHVYTNPNEVYPESSWYSDNCVLADSVDFAGYENTSVTYYFDADNHLASILYVPFHFTDDQDSADKQYRLFNNALEKYGIPIAENGEYIMIDENSYDTVRYLSDSFFNENYSGKNLSRKSSTRILASAQRLFYTVNFLRD